LVLAALGRYGLPTEAAVEFVRHGENTTYRVTGGDGVRFALRVHRPGYQSPEAIRSELAWMDSLREGDIRTPAVLPGLDGDPLQTVPAPGGESRTAVMFEWIEGVPLSAVADVEPWQRLGALMARIHAHARAWERPAWFMRPAWDAGALVGDDPRWGPPDPDHVLAADDRSVLESCRAEVSRRMEAIGQEEDRYGLIHADLGFENVLVSDDGSVAIIDFDDCGESWYLHDFAVALYPHDRSDGFGARREALIDGYGQVVPMPDELLAELPTFLMARRIQTLGWVFSRAETAHAQRQRAPRLASTPSATREYLAWARTTSR
jgi:Ser/Thr protein kinase RdoA (MazF antagonist)